MRDAASGPPGPRSSAAQYPTPGTPARALAAVPASQFWACALFRTCGPPRGAALAEARHAPACARKRAYQRVDRSSRTTRTRGGRKRPKRTGCTGGSGRHRRIYWRGSSGALPATCHYRCACSRTAPAARSWRRCQWLPWWASSRDSRRTRANRALSGWPHTTQSIVSGGLSAKTTRRIDERARIEQERTKWHRGRRLKWTNT